MTILWVNKPDLLISYFFPCATLCLFLVTKKLFFSLKQDKINFKCHWFVCFEEYTWSVDSEKCPQGCLRTNFLRDFNHDFDWVSGPTPSTHVFHTRLQRDRNCSSLSLLCAGTRVPTSSGQTRLPTSCITSAAVISSQHLHFFHLMQPKFSSNPLQAKIKKKKERPLTMITKKSRWSHNKARNTHN